MDINKAWKGKTNRVDSFRYFLLYNCFDICYFKWLQWCIEASNLLIYILSKLKGITQTKYSKYILREKRVGRVIYQKPETHWVLHHWGHHPCHDHKEQIFFLTPSHIDLLKHVFHNQTMDLLDAVLLFGQNKKLVGPKNNQKSIIKYKAPEFYKIGSQIIIPTSSRTYPYMPKAKQLHYCINARVS